MGACCSLQPSNDPNGAAVPKASFEDTLASLGSATSQQDGAFSPAGEESSTTADTDAGARPKQCDEGKPAAHPRTGAAEPKDVESDFQARRVVEVLAGAKFDPDVPGKIARRPSSENITMDGYTAKHTSEFERLLSFEDNTGWSFSRTTEGVRIYTKAMDGCDLMYFKGVAEIKVEQGLYHILQTILRVEDRPRWDDMCIMGSTEQLYAPFYNYVYCKMQAPYNVVTSRDFMMVGRFRFEKDGALLISISSVSYPEMPNDPKMVRGEFLEGGYIVRPKPGSDNEFVITWTGCVDPHGWLPKWLVNLLVPMQALTLAKAKKFL